jgi:hypothetical protein
MAGQAGEQPAVVAHEEVDEAEIAPGAYGVGVVGGEGVEDFGLDAAVGHAARFLRKAVSTVSPGPKARAQVRESACAAGWRSISWRTKRMVGRKRRGAGMRGARI